MKYYYKKDKEIWCIEKCENFINKEDKSNIIDVKIGSTVCARLCENFITKNTDYIECKYLNKLDRYKKLNSL